MSASLGANRAIRRLHPGEQLGRVERLDQVVVGARAQRADLALHVAVGREHDDRDVAAGAFLGADPGRDLVAVDAPGPSRRAGSATATPVCHSAQPSAPSDGDEDLVALLLEGELEEPLHARVVIDDEDLAGHPISRIDAARAAGRDRPTPAAS